MSRAVQWIIKSGLIIGLLLLAGGCATRFQKPEEVIKNQTRQKVFLHPYDEVWRAAHTVLKYPIVNENQDTGLIETDYIKAEDGFLPPEQRPPSSGLRYKIVMIFAKGKSHGQESVRVTLDKKMEKLRDFFSDAEVVSSDGLEEKILFYRMERELLIAKGLRKAAEDRAAAPPM